MTKTITTRSGSQYVLHYGQGPFWYIVDQGRELLVTMVGESRESSIDWMMDNNVAFTKCRSINGAKAIGVPNSKATFEGKGPKVGWRMIFVEWTTKKIVKYTTNITDIEDGDVRPAPAAQSWRSRVTACH